MGLINKEAWPPEKAIPPPVWTASSPKPAPVDSIEAPLSATKALLVPTAPANASFFIPLTPSKPVRQMQTVNPDLNRIQKLFVFPWYYLKFLYGGMKVTWAETTERTRILNGIQDGGDTLTWREMQFCARVKKDRLKMIPFLLVACTIEELIPIILIAFPDALPTTTLLPSQTLKMYEAQESKLMKARQRVYELLQHPKLDKNGKPQLELGWNADAWIDWTREDQKLLLTVYGKWKGLVSTKTYVEGRLYNVLNEIAQEDDHMMTRPPPEGLTREEFCFLLSRRGLLVNALPSSALPHILHDYLQARRTDPRFHPFAYTFTDIALNQPRLAAAAAALPTMASVNAAREANGEISWWEGVSDKMEEYVGHRVDGRENKLVGIEKAKEERERVGEEAVEVKVLEGVKKVPRIEGLGTISAAPKEKKEQGRIEL